jgi:hypothetical protein
MPDKNGNPCLPASRQDWSDWPELMVHKESLVDSPKTLFGFLILIYMWFNTVAVNPLSLPQ